MYTPIFEDDTLDSIHLLYPTDKKRKQHNHTWGANAGYSRLDLTTVVLVHTRAVGTVIVVVVIATAVAIIPVTPANVVVIVTVAVASPCWMAARAVASGACEFWI